MKEVNYTYLSVFTHHEPDEIRPNQFVSRKKHWYGMLMLAGILLGSEFAGAQNLKGKIGQSSAGGAGAARFNLVEATVPQMLHAMQTGLLTSKQLATMYIVLPQMECPKSDKGVSCDGDNTNPRHENKRRLEERGPRPTALHR